MDKCVTCLNSLFLVLRNGPTADRKASFFQCYIWPEVNTVVVLNTGGVGAKLLQVLGLVIFHVTEFPGLYFLYFCQ